MDGKYDLQDNSANSSEVGHFVQSFEALLSVYEKLLAFQN
jgi:hypothetical protein